jgi:uncharacterized protein YwqG
MSKRLIFTAPSNDPYEARIGGGALFEGVEDWPNAPDGTPLMLIASIPSNFIAQHTGIKLPKNFFVSIFSYYSDVEYFLDQITYHGDPDELSLIKSGTTKVIQHYAGKEICQSCFIPPRRLEIREIITDEEDCESRIGGAPFLLQNERLNLQKLSYILQLRSSDFPAKYSDIFGVSDALGYLYLQEGGVSEGIFFAQTT